MSTIVLTTKEWKEIKEKIEQQHGKNIFLISWRCKRELGFVVRTHLEWAEDSRFDEQDRRIQCRQESIRLDFYHEAAATMFRLAYL